MKNSSSKLFLNIVFLFAEIEFLEKFYLHEKYVN